MRNYNLRTPEPQANLRAINPTHARCGTRKNISDAKRTSQMATNTQSEDILHRIYLIYYTISLSELRTTN